MSKVVSKNLHRLLGDGDNQIEAKSEGENIWIGDGDEMSLMLTPAAIADLVSFQKEVQEVLDTEDRVG